jgi:hypothetical protein
VSVAQADEVIIALPGEKSKMSIYDKTPPERVSFRSFFGDFVVNFPQAGHNSRRS